MKKLILSSIIMVSSQFTFAQSECDSLACNQYAPMNSFEIIGETNKKDTDESLNHMISCEMLCEIEAARKDYQDVLIELGGYVIRVFKKEEIILNEEK